MEVEEMKISKLRLTRVLAVLMVLVLVLCSCSKNEAETVSGDDGKGVASSAISTNGAGTDGTVEKKEDYPASDKDEKVTAADEGYGLLKPEPTSAAGASETVESVGRYSAEEPALISDAAMAKESGYAGAYDLFGFTDGVAEAEPEGTDSFVDDMSGSTPFPMAPDADVEIDEDIYVKPYYQPGAHMLSAAEWNDNRNFDFLKELIKNGQETNYKEYFEGWGMDPLKRIVIHCDAAGQPAVNATVTVKNANGVPLCATRTDAAGDAYCYYNLDKNDQIPAKAEISYNGESQEVELAAVLDVLGDDAATSVSFAQQGTTQKKLELMYVVDTTGSMGDEIEFLQAEVADVINRVRKENDNISISLSMNFYRDQGDDYVVRSNEFSDDIDAQIALLMKEYASGGGDYEEAVEEALKDAVTGHAWSEDSVKVMFMILDAPPHNTAAVRGTLAKYLPLAAEKGIRIVPVAASGVDKSTEFLLRTFAMVTGGTYCFLTNDSGIGGGHIEATVGDHVVEFLDDLMVRVIGNFITGKYVEADPERAFVTPNREPGYAEPVDIYPVVEEPVDDICYVDVD